ncbi:hypothetical protein Scep_030354 [Stephania cephalantha]|uniref:Uncharacterized protein n=1 Tax=Stephania cephalantha TaxID=152367 RepID=A0AAP0E2P6_9MAGN
MWAKLVRRREQHTQATPDQPIDEDQLYYDATGEYPKGSLAKRKRRYDDPEPVGNMHGLLSKHLSSTTTATAATTLGALPAGRDGFSSFTIAAT